MSRKIWKFPVDPLVPLVAMPRGSEVLSAGEQNGQLVIWAAVHDHLNDTSHQVMVIPTGGRVPSDDFRFVNTVQGTGNLVFHVFQKALSE